MIAEFAWTHGSAAWRLLLLLLLLNPTQRNPLEATINSSPHVPPWRKISFGRSESAVEKFRKSYDCPLDENVRPIYMYEP